MDIRPGSCQNPVNPSSRGVLTVAIIGSEDLDVAEIDLDSVCLARADGVGEMVQPLVNRHGTRPKIHDVASFTGQAPCECTHSGPDGIDDLILKFSTEQLAAAFELSGGEHGDVLGLKLSATLSDGTALSAEDCIRIVGGGARGSPP